MTSVQCVSNPEDCREFHHGHPPLMGKCHEVRVIRVRRRLAMVTNNVGDDEKVISAYPKQLGIAHYVLSVFVVPARANVRANVVQRRPDLQEEPAVLVEPMKGGSLIKNTDRQAGDMVCVSLVSGIAARECPRWR